MTMTIQKEGRRYYITGNTYPIKDQLRASGCKWDSAKRAWWTGKADVAESFATVEAPASTTPVGQDRETVSETDACIGGRVTYKGRTYYAIGRAVRGTTRYNDQVELVESRTGKFKLTSRDGSLVFWASTGLVQVQKYYQRLQSIKGLREYAASMQGGSASTGYTPKRGVDYCGYSCPVDGHRCTADNPCHDCR